MQDDFTTISTKMPRVEAARLKDYCKKKGISTSKLLRDLINREVEIPLPHSVAGRNIIEYSREKDIYSWFIELETGDRVEVLSDIKPAYLEDLKAILDRQIQERDAFIGKEKKDSVPVPSELVRRGKD